MPPADTGSVPFSARRPTIAETMDANLGNPHPEAVRWAERRLSEPVVEAASYYARDGRSTLRLTTESGRAAYLKVAPDLAGERARLGWLEGRLPTPAVLSFEPGRSDDWLLTEGLPGSDLTSPNHTSRPRELIHHLAAALHRIHALDPTSCPFGVAARGHVVVHGDACLPNFLIEGDYLSGYLDVGSLGLAGVEVDLAAAVWSLHHNLGPGWGPPFLEAYGWPHHDDATVEALRQRY